MAANQFEDSRIASGTLKPGAQKIGETSVSIPNESRAISRDDVRDGFATNPVASNTNPHNTNPRRILSADSLVGAHVRNSAGEDLGTIDQIMVDITANRIAYAVVSIGGFLGIGAKLVAVPWSVLRMNEGEHDETTDFILNADRKTLKDAPSFDRGTWPDMTDTAYGDQIHQHFGQTPYWVKDFTDAGDYVGDNVHHNRSVEYEQTTRYHAGTRH
jgi:sporulation protein YlmC with PRC-barrel domain